MRLGLVTVSVMLVAAGAAWAAEPPPVEAASATAIESFAPLWRPPVDQLQGWVVGIDPVSQRSSEPGARRCDDLSLLTAAHLYQLIRAAGGSPVLTRADDTHAAEPGGPDWQRRVEVIRAADCDLCVSISCGRTGAQVATVRSAPERQRNHALLVGALLDALGAAPATPDNASFITALSRTEGLTDVAACEVRLDCSAQHAATGVAARKACWADARRLYTGVSRFCDDNPKTADGASGQPSGPDYSGPRRGSRLARLGRSIWPHGRLPAERLDWFCDMFARLSITNRSLVYFEVRAALEEDVVVLSGRTNVPQLAGGLATALQSVDREQVRNDVQTLPDRTHLSQHLFGACRAQAALTYDQPGHRGHVQTQLLFGEPLFLMDRTDDHYLLLAGDGYWGWVPCDVVQPMTAEQFDAYRRLPRGVVLRDIADHQVTIPRGSVVRVARAGDDERVISLPDGSTLTVPAAEVALPDARDFHAAARVRAALDLLYVPYVFGGRSPLGLDCSGLVSSVWARAGQVPSRDAWQQAFAGALVATSWHRAGIQAGDQLFFINSSGKVYHTAVALDGGYYVHAAPPCVQISSFDRRDPLYDAYSDRTFFLAKRP